MAKINTLNYQTVAAWNGSQDLFVVEQPDDTKVATPAMVKQFIEAGDFEATGEVKDGHGNILKDMAKSVDVDAEIGDLAQTGLTGDSVAEQLAGLNTISDKVTITTTASGVTVIRGEYYTLGKIVFVSLDVTITGTAIIATLPKPVSQVDVLNCDYPNNSNGAFVELRTNGELELRKGSGASSARLIANLIYLSNDV